MYGYGMVWAYVPIASNNSGAQPYSQGIMHPGARQWDSKSITVVEEGSSYGDCLILRLEVRMSD